MSDAGRTSQHPGGSTSGAATDLKRAGEEIRSGAAEAAAQARGVAASVKEEVRRAASDLRQEGSEIAEAAQARALGFAEEQKRFGADQAEGMARAVRRAADELEQASPQMAHYVREAASSVDGLARALRDSSPGDLMGQVQDFARRQPVAFFGAAALAGFAIARFAKSSARPSEPEGLYPVYGGGSYGNGGSYSGMEADAPMGAGMGSGAYSGGSYGGGVGSASSTSGLGGASQGTSGLGGASSGSTAGAGLGVDRPQTGSSSLGTESGSDLGGTSTGLGTGGSPRKDDLGGPRQPGSGPLAGL